MNYKPSAADWKLIKTVALKGAYLNDRPITSLAGVSLECHSQRNVNDLTVDVHINIALVTRESPIERWSDCDMFDQGKHLTNEFRRGVELQDKRGIFDFSIYNRYDRDGDLAGDVIVDVLDGKLVRIWVEGGHPASWTPDIGVVEDKLVVEV